MGEQGYVPPYTITDKTVNLISAITEILTKLSYHPVISSNPRLRRDNRIRTIHSSLAIENNSLSIDQMTAVINGKRILGAAEEIREVKNAFEVYNILLDLSPFSIKDLLKAHKILMKDLTKEAGTFRHGGVGVFAGEKLVHMAPPANQVPHLIENLFGWIKKANAHPLIKSSVFHYEFEFIHPFSDGNGRMGRMWQTLILYQWNSLFGWLPVETLIRERQGEYYKVLGESDRSADSGKFVEFMLAAIHDALLELMNNEQAKVQASEQIQIEVSEQVKKLLAVMDDESYSTQELIQLLGLKHRVSFRNYYLLPAIQLGYIEMTIPDKPNSSKQKYRKIPI